MSFSRNWRLVRIWPISFSSSLTRAASRELVPPAPLPPTAGPLPGPCCRSECCLERSSSLIFSCACNRWRRLLTSPDLVYSSLHVVIIDQFLITPRSGVDQPCARQRGRGTLCRPWRETSCCRVAGGPHQGRGVTDEAAREPATHHRANTAQGVGENGWGERRLQLVAFGVHVVQTTPIHRCKIHAFSTLYPLLYSPSRRSLCKFCENYRRVRRR